MSYIHVMHSVYIDIKWFCGNFRVPHSVLLRPSISYLLCYSLTAAIFIGLPLPLPLSLSLSFSIFTALASFGSPSHKKQGLQLKAPLSLSRLPRIQSSPRLFLTQIPRASRVYRSAQLLLRALLNLSLSLRHVLEAHSSFCLLTCK